MIVVTSLLRSSSCKNVKQPGFVSYGHKLVPTD
jgi:hypothetical protein